MRFLYFISGDSITHHPCHAQTTPIGRRTVQRGGQSGCSHAPFIDPARLDDHLSICIYILLGCDTDVHRHYR